MHRFQRFSKILQECKDVPCIRHCMPQSPFRFLFSRVRKASFLTIHLEFLKKKFQILIFVQGCGPCHEITYHKRMQFLATGPTRGIGRNLLSLPYSTLFYFFFSHGLLFIFLMLILIFFCG